MINTDNYKSTYTTVADQATWYPVTFQYDSPNNTPELWVTIDGEGKTYGTDYIVGVGGVQLTYEPDAGLELVIRRNVPLTQEIDFQIGIIDPEQIEHGFDRSVMRDQEIADYAVETNGRVEEIENTISSYGDIVTHNVSEFATAAQGAKADTAVQPGDNVSALTNDANYVVASDLATVATSGSYNDLTDKPTIGNGTITITQGGITKGSFSVNQAGATTIEVDEGGGDVDSVNGKTGVVVLNASDVGALPSSTKYGASLSLSINSTTYVLTATLKDQNGNTLGSAQTIDLPLESVVVSGSYDSATKEVVLTLQSGSTIRFSVADLVSGLQTEITSLNMLSADLVSDSTTTNKFVTASEKSAIATAVQPGDLASVATSGDYGDLLNKPSLATVATSGDYDDLLNKPTIPDTTHMVTDNTAQSISAVKTFTAANPDATTAQTIVANYAVKFGTSGNNDLFAISANTNTSTLSIVGDNASNVIDIAASGAVLNHLQVTSSDVTFGGNSLINPGVMTGADGVNAGASGLVPAPAATDNVKFLRGDGSWSKALENTATGANSLSIGGAVATSNGAVNIGMQSRAPATESTIVGWYASAEGNGAVSVGAGAQASGVNSISIGKYALASAHSIQLNASGTTRTNVNSNTFKVANQNGNFEIMSADGTIPEARLADTTNAQQGDVLTLDSTGNAVWQACGGAVDSVNGKTGVVVLSATDVNAVPQYETMPTASASNVGEIAQYSGQSILDSYQNGYFYKSSAEYSDPTATISQTVGSGLSDLAVSVDTFIEAEQPTQNETVAFTAIVTPDSVVYDPDKVSDPNSYLMTRISQMLGTENIYIVITAVDGNNVATEIQAFNQIGGFFTITQQDLVDNNVVISNVSVNDTIYLTFIQGTTTWEKDSETVDLATYGISFSGTPNNGDVLTVVYTAPTPIGYSWEQIDVQPSSGGGNTGIDWKIKSDLTVGDYGYRHLTIPNGLPNGTYEYYIQIKRTSSEFGYRPLSYVTYKIVMKVDNDNQQYRALVNPILNGDYATTVYAPLRNYDEGQVIFISGSDMTFSLTTFRTNIPDYSPAETIVDCYKLSAIKNVDTNQEYVGTLSENEPQPFDETRSITYSFGTVDEIPYVPKYAGTGTLYFENGDYVNVSDKYYASNTVMLRIGLRAGFDEYQADIALYRNGHSIKVRKATGVFAQTEFVKDEDGKIFIKLNAPVGTTGSFVYVVGGISEDSIGGMSMQVPSGTPTVLSTDMVGGIVDTNNIDIISQYIGTTTASYTNGCFYKATGTIVTTPESAVCTETSSTGTTITCTNISGLVNKLASLTGWSTEYTKETLEWSFFQISQDQTSISYSAYGSWSGQDAADLIACFSFSPALSDSIEFNVRYVPATQEVQNGAWVLVDTQFTGITGYDATKTQVLKNVQGVLTWVDE